MANVIKQFTLVIYDYTAAQSVAMLSSRLVHKGPGNSLGTMVNVIKGDQGSRVERLMNELLL